MRGKIDISVVIPVKNGEKYLADLLKGIFSQEINYGFEVIAVDSGSTDGTLELINKYPVRLFRVGEREFNHGLTRNFGIAQSCGEYIILVSQDAIPCDNHWMEKLVINLVNDQSVAGAYSRQIPRASAKPYVKALVHRFFAASSLRRESRIGNPKDYEGLTPNEKYELCCFDNVSSCIRKSVWESIPFPRTDFGEDIEWSRAVLQNGYGIVYEPGSAVYHSHDFSVRGWYGRNLVNSRKLFEMFGVNTVNNYCQLLSRWPINSFRDICSIRRCSRSVPAAVSGIFLVPIYVFCGLLGQYRGINNSGLNGEAR